MFLPENIDLAYSEKYNLSIRLTSNGFSFCIYCPGNSSIFHYQETELGNKLSSIDTIKKIIFDLGFFSQAFNKTTVTIVSSYYTLVPDAFFDKNGRKACSISTFMMWRVSYFRMTQQTEDIISFLYGRGDTFVSVAQFVESYIPSPCLIAFESVRKRHYGESRWYK